MTIKPIETMYNGYRFRSRLEARWAVFFDAAGIKYEYEPEGYETSCGKYLPDFYLPDSDSHVEVKADRHGAVNELCKAAAAINWGSPIKRIVILSDIPNHHDGGEWQYPVLYWNSIEDRVDLRWWHFTEYGPSRTIIGAVNEETYRRPWYFLGHTFSLSRCQDAQDRVYFGAVSDRELCREVNRRSIYDIDPETALIMNKRIYNALDYARQARFEHGETPKAGGEKP